jgi:hypothetical protein
VDGHPWASPRENIGLVEFNGALCVVHAKLRKVDLWLSSGIKKDFWFKAYSVRAGRVIDVVPLRIMGADAKFLFYCCNNHGSPAIIHVYEPRSEKCTDVVKAPNIAGRIGLCSSHVLGS